MLAAKAGRNAPTDGLRDASTNFDIWLPDNHSRLDRATSAATLLRRKQPFAIRIGKTLDWDHADASLIVAAVTRAETNAPPVRSFISTEKNDSIPS
ncbi:uncharacterized protein N7473_004300 [Penicillium subrubescens]|uniref:uncharacterized protein n=1 Tax=Penicillium subrubescens TaxID=1316194 RepID=UPI002544F3CB|nr:uncharacterized protein N7473_004300 [Penicillium subrubescens]KAJ5900230.1 hypothetical protein N7473_004300 [Penicillium subrubescens]